MCETARNLIESHERFHQIHLLFYITLPFKDQRSANRVRKEIHSLVSMIDVKTYLCKQKIIANSERKGKQAPDRQHAMH